MAQDVRNAQMKITERRNALTFNGTSVESLLAKRASTSNSVTQATDRPVDQTRSSPLQPQEVTLPLGIAAAKLSQVKPKKKAFLFFNRATYQ